MRADDGCMQEYYHKMNEAKWLMTTGYTLSLYIFFFSLLNSFSSFFDRVLLNTETNRVKCHNDEIQKTKQKQFNRFKISSSTLDLLWFYNATNSYRCRQFGVRITLNLCLRTNCPFLSLYFSLCNARAMLFTRLVKHWMPLCRLHTSCTAHYTA